MFKFKQKGWSRPASKKSNLFYFHDEIDKIFFRMELIMHDKGAADNFPLRLFIADHDKVTFMGNKR